MNIRDQLALVTGGGSGMGESVCRHLAEKGAHVIVMDTSEARAKQVASDIQGTPIVCDVSDASALEVAFASFEQSHSRPLSIVVNCAGIAPAKRMVGKNGPVPLDWFEHVIKVNLIGTFNVMRLGVAQMIKNDKQEERGVIINTASIAGFEGQIGQTAYSASKGGIIAMTLPAARECAQFGIRVMTIAPGLIDTPMMQGFSEEVRDALIKTTVFPKRLGLASEFAALVQHIIENPLLNGETIRLDGAIRLAP
jgi:NAD(P)-dependent dehydrogenase (short-subunit alcohol dehydrogenase family)